MTPKELLNFQVQEFNKGNLDLIMALYENEACFAERPDQVVKDLESIRQSMQRLIEMGGRLEVNVERVLQASNVALMITEWSISDIESDGIATTLTGRGTVVLRQQSNGC